MSPSLPRSAALGLALGLAALGLAVLSAPSGCAQATPCQFNSDCAVGYCSNGACKQDCVDSARDCPPGYTCDVNAQCVAGGTGGGTTSSTSSSSSSATSSTSSGPA